MPPGVLLKQRGAQDDKPVVAVFERPDDRLAFLNLQREDLHVAAVAILQAVGEVGVVDEAGELEDQIVMDRDAG